MRHVIFATCSLTPAHLVSLIDLANQILEDENNFVLWIDCDSGVSTCFNNPFGSASICMKCKVASILAKTKIQRRNRFKSKSISSYINKNTTYEFVYNNSDELKDIIYKGANIGLAVISTYITLSRNLYPKMTNDMHLFFDAFLQAAAKMTDATLNIVDKEIIDTVYLFNGRLNNSRPIVDICSSTNQEFCCVELVPKFNLSSYNRILFKNSMPHSIKDNTRIIEQAWLNHANYSHRDIDAHNFFLNRRQAIPAGDVVYTAHQVDGLLPNNWNSSIENIVIFNSSEDEFIGIGGEWVTDNLFRSQIEGIKEICDHFKDDTTKQFYLKIHPNLRGIRYKYHLDLYKLSYPNLQVLSADSPVSTYSMIDKCSKVIVFGSSTGAEASYSKKTVIQLSKSLYNFADTTYIPKSKEELWKLIDTIDLKSKYNDNILKYGFFCNSACIGDEINLDVSPVSFKLLNRYYMNCKGLSIFGSAKIYTIITLFTKVFFTFLCTNRIVKFKSIPCDEA